MITINISNQRSFYPKRFDIMCISANGSASVVIRKKHDKENGMWRVSMFPYEKQEARLAQFVWWQLLKLLTYLKMI